MVKGGALVCLLEVSACAAAGGPTYVGAAVCARCHADQHRQWSGSRHSKMVQPATATAVQGDFSRRQVTLHGETYLLRARNGQFFITESYLTGKPREHHVDYTLGNRRIQHYLTTLASGRIVVLPPSWDILRKGWFHSSDIDDPDEFGTMVQVWNRSCFSCHVSREQKNFNPESSDYHTTWQDFGNNCERCHGPGSRHVADYSAAVKPAARPADIVVQTRLDAARSTMVCAQCHSFRDIYVDGFQAGADYYDYFLPILEFSQPLDRDPAYWADGRTRRFSNDAFGLWQSECFLKGKVTCVDCHVKPHEVEIERNPQLRPDANALCTHCHTAIGEKLAAHTHHGPRSAGSSCVECHMPRTVLSIKAQIRDHSMSIPAPENTLRHGIPNACNLCHKDRDANWALGRINEWYGAELRQKLIRRADAFTAARKGDAAAVPLLIAILQQPPEGALARGNALGHLESFTHDPRVFPVVEQALGDPEPLVRALAALRITPAADQRAEAIGALIRTLADPATIARMAAAVTLVSLGVSELAGEDGQRFAAAKQLFGARVALDGDDPEQQLGAGKFYLLSGDPASAIGALETSLRLEPDIPARYYLAYAYAQRGRLHEARRILHAIPPADAQFAPAQRLLKAIGPE